MAYRVIIECDTVEEAQAVQRRLQQPQVREQTQVRENRPPLRELEPYCHGCQSHGCICKRISTGYLIG